MKNVFYTHRIEVNKDGKWVHTAVSDLKTKDSIRFVSLEDGSVYKRPYDDKIEFSVEALFSTAISADIEVKP